MRRLLFRGKTLLTGDWEYGAYVRFRAVDGSIYDAIIQECNGENLMGEVYSIEPETLCQYTGMTDKNSEEIFEGDIVITQYGRKCVVEWFSSPTHCGWDLRPLSSDGMPPQKAFLWHKDYIEVIGNIYDNPEML